MSAARFRHGSSRAHAWLYRRSGGRLLARMGGHPVLLLTTTGRRSGRARTTPVQYHEIDGSTVVVAAAGGSKRPPDWSRNIAANHDVLVQRGAQAVSMHAREAEGQERARLWALLTRDNRWLERAERKAERRLPVIVLEPVEGLNGSVVSRDRRGD
jgi:deazaflavin-dependent oxidoreductase (nitroreductase family)